MTGFEKISWKIIFFLYWFVYKIIKSTFSCFFILKGIKYLLLQWFWAIILIFLSGLSGAGHILALPFFDDFLIVFEF